MEMQNQQNPPKRALRFLRWYCSANRIEEIEGDLEEFFSYRLEKMSAKRAKRLYWWDVIRCFRPYAWKKNLEVKPISSVIMFKNYLKIAQRQLLKSKVNGAINIAGLSMGIAICLLVTLFVHDEFSYDKFHEKGERIYKLNVKMKYYGEEHNGTMTSPIMLSSFKENFTWVEDGARMRLGITFLKDLNGEILREQFHYVDESFFEVFDFSLLHGDKSNVLSSPSSIVLDEPTARRITGTSNPIGETVELKFGDKMYPFQITGVAKEFPTNSSIQMKFAIPMSFYQSMVPEKDLLVGWTYV